ncbi:hypothetical protein FACS1894116_12560 [Betaproteobacteria bacterium]|nr:hypothetical protein FACS1894116_12560 [Betaproteobacteria bacterium]
MYALEVIERGEDKDMALKLAQYFYERLSDEEGGRITFSHALLHKYMHLVLRRMVVGDWSPEQAMGFKSRRRGKPFEDNKERDIDIALYVRDARAQDKNMSFEYAVADACDKFYVSESTVTRACAKYTEYLPPFGFQSTGTDTDA